MFNTELDTELEVPFLAAAIPAAIAGFLYSGWFGSRISFLFCLGLASIGGILGGVFHGRSTIERLLFIIPFLIWSSIFMTLTAWYISYRATIFYIEVLIPAAIALIPFGISYMFISKIAAKYPPEVKRITQKKTLLG